MSVSFARPDITELVFHLYGRSVHPELIEVYAESAVAHDRYTAFVRICGAGHMVGFRAPGQTISEVMAARQQPLPSRKRLLERRLQGQRHETFRLDSGLRYHLSYQVEQLDPEVYLNYHEELIEDCKRADVAHRFPAAGRLAPEPISLIRTDADNRSLLVHAFHTFPDRCAVVKTQSLIEL